MVRAARIRPDEITSARPLAVVALELGYSARTVGRWLVAQGAMRSPIAAERLACRVADELKRTIRERAVRRLGRDAASTMDAQLSMFCGSAGGAESQAAEPTDISPVLAMGIHPAWEGKNVADLGAAIHAHCVNGTKGLTRANWAIDRFLTRASNYNMLGAYDPDTVATRRALLVTEDTLTRLEKIRGLGKASMRAIRQIVLTMPPPLPVAV